MIVKITLEEFENIKNQFVSNPNWDSVIVELNDDSKETSEPVLAEANLSLSDFANAGDM